MIKENIKLVNKLGLHARAAMKLTTMSNRYESTIKINYRQRTIDAKSIMNLLVLGASYGAELEFNLDGKDENEAWQAIKQLIHNRFDEEQ